MKKYVYCFVFVFLTSVNALAEEPLTVHEWGTITTQHFDIGMPSGHLNGIRSAGNSAGIRVNRF